MALLNASFLIFRMTQIYKLPRAELVQSFSHRSLTISDRPVAMAPLPRKDNGHTVRRHILINLKRQVE
jgi:hypothetical protein